MISGIEPKYRSLSEIHRQTCSATISNISNRSAQPQEFIYVRAGSSVSPQVSSATNAACNSNSNVTHILLSVFGIMLTAMNSSGRGLHSQFFFCEGPRTGASAAKVSRPITGLRRGQYSQAFTVGRKIYNPFFFSERAAFRCSKACLYKV